MFADEVALGFVFPAESEVVEDVCPAGFEAGAEVVAGVVRVDCLDSHSLGPIERSRA